MSIYLSKTQRENIQAQGDGMRCIPLMEYQIGLDDYMVVNLSLQSNKRCAWITFNIDESNNTDVRFSGDIKRIRQGLYKLYIESYFDDLDTYLQLIDQEIIEGFLIPNSLYGDFDND